MAEYGITPAIHDGKFFAANPAKAQAIASLAALVKTRWGLSVRHKIASGVQKDITECRHAMAGRPIGGSHIDPSLPVTLNITASICEGVHAMLVDAITVAADNTFTIKPTPIPELPADAQADIMRQLQDMAEAMAQLGTQMTLPELTTAATDLAKARMQEEARRAKIAAEDLRTIVRDMLVEGDFNVALKQVLHDYVSSMAAIIKAPAVKPKLKRVWNGGRMSFKTQLVRGVERIDPEHFYLAPANGYITPQQAEWVFEMRRIQPSDLMALSSDPNYDAKEILRVFQTYPEGYVEMENGQPSIMIGDSAAYTRSFAYDILEMHGLIKGSVLADMGIAVGNPDMAYESVIITIGECVIAAMVNTDATGMRPYHMASFYNSPETPWGGSPASRLRDLQRVITSLFIALGGDAALAGVHVELDPTMMHADDRISRNAVQPRTVRLVKRDMSGQRERAYNLFTVQSQIAAFHTEIVNLHALAYEIVGIPRMALGQTSGAGTLGRTAGGVASMLNQATKGTRQSILAIETGLIEPVVQGFIDWVLMFRPPMGFSGDVMAQARGLSGLVEQAEQADDLAWAIQTIAPLEGQQNPDGTPVIPPGATARLVFRMFKAKGVPTEGVFSQDYDLTDALSGQSASPMPARTAQGFGPSGPTTLDSSRSPTAAAAIQANNNPMALAA